MRTKLATLALAGTLGLTGIAGAALLAPAVSYAATGDTTALTDRVSRITEALAGLVTDGTLTQEQADTVASTLAEALPEGRHGGHGGKIALGAVADALGLTPQELRAESEAGKTLGEIAAEQGVAEADLVATLVAEAQERLDAAVADGRLTQAEADERAAALTDRITASLDEVLRPRGHGRGHGPGGHGPEGHGPGGHGPDEQEAPSSDASPEIEESSAT